MDGIVVFFCGSEGTSGDIWFRVPNISYNEYIELLDWLSSEFSCSLTPQMESENEYQQTNITDPQIFFSANKASMLAEDIVEMDDSPLKISAYFYTLAGDVPMYWSLDPAPNYGQGETILNELWITFSYPSDATFW